MRRPTAVLVAGVMLLAGGLSAAQPGPVDEQELRAAIDQLGAFDYDTRTAASGLGLYDALDRFSTLGTDAFVITRIERDGTLGGSDLDGLGGALAATGIDVVASGGVSSPSDLEDLADLEVDGRRLAGIIIGRALYEGTVDLATAIRTLGGR